MRLFLIASAFVIGTAVSASANVLIEIDKSTQHMRVSVDGAPRYSWPVSTGRDWYTTPGGHFTVDRMMVEHFSKEWDDAPMPHSIFFTTQGHAIHGTNDIRHLGKPASHGCVRLSPDNAATLYALVEAEGMEATEVVISGEDFPGVGDLQEWGSGNVPGVALGAEWDSYYKMPAWPSYDETEKAGPKTSTW